MAHRVVKTQREETPEFITNLKETQKLANKAIEVSNGQIITRSFRSRMRSLQIVRAFYKNKPITSVESGKMDDVDFMVAVYGAIDYMREMAENVHNKQFDAWLKEQLKDTKYAVVSNTEAKTLIVI